MPLTGMHLEVYLCRNRNGRQAKDVNLKKGIPSAPSLSPGPFGVPRSDIYLIRCFSADILARNPALCTGYKEMSFLPLSNNACH